MAAKNRGGRPKTVIGHRDDVAEGIAEAMRLLREIHAANYHHTRAQIARTRAAFIAITRADRAFRRQREPELTPVSHLRRVGE